LWKVREKHTYEYVWLKFQRLWRYSYSKLQYGKGMKYRNIVMQKIPRGREKSKLDAPR
jgi:hypothetical protein